MGDDKELLLRVFDAFREDFASWAMQARSAWQAQDFGALVALAHTLKGGAGGIGAVKVEQAAIALEAALRGRQQDPEVGEKTMAALVDGACAALQDALDALERTLDPP